MANDEERMGNVTSAGVIAMNTSNRRWQRMRSLSACLWVMVCAAGVRAQPAQATRPAQRGPQTADRPAKEINPLAAKQEMIGGRFRRFEDRVFSLREQLSETEPENAARLRAAACGRALSDKLEETLRC